VPDLRPDELEGKWCCEIAEADGHTQKRVLEIKNGALALSTLDAEGRVRSCARGRLKLLDTAEAQAMTLTDGVELAAGI
jgi:hypothetical protein